MVCPSCGKQVAGTQACCGSCGADLKHGDSPPSVGGGTVPIASKDRSRQRRAETLCLVFGTASLVFVPVAFAIGSLSDSRPWEHSLFNEVLSAVAITLFLSAFPAGVLALFLGWRANKASSRMEGESSRDARVKLGIVSAVAGTALWFILPNLLRSRINGDGSSPVGTLHTINTAAMTYFCTYGHGYPRKLSNLGYDPSMKGETSEQAASLIDEILASGTKAGYRYYYVAGPVDDQGKILTYTVHADPLKSRAKEPHYLTDQTGVIRQELKRQADAGSPIIEDVHRKSGGDDDCREIRGFYSPPPQTPPP